MRTWKLDMRSAVWVSLIVAVLLACVVSYAQEAPPLPPAPPVAIVTQAGDSVTPTPPGVSVGIASGVLDTLISKYTWLAKVLIIVGLLRVFLKPIVTCIESVVASTATKKDDEILQKVETSTAWKWAFWILDYLASFKLPTAGNVTANPLVKSK